jgi:acyl-CoA reductase-like NAD-dependent aldehyde dehydrogenase
MAIRKHSFFINGEWIEGTDYFDLHSPYSNEKVAEIPVASEEDTKKAIDSAEAAGRSMSQLTLLERAEILGRVAEIFREKFEECAQTLTLENAKPISAARQEIERTIETYRFASDEAKKVAGEIIPMDAARSGKDKFGFTKKEPLGVIAAITPFNFPFNLVAHKLGPAFAMGNTVVLKPASQTPLSAIMTAEIFEQAGLPKGALNVIFGPGSKVGNVLTTSEAVKMVTFTGSVEVGKKIKESAGLKKVALELGSNSGVIIDSVNDIEKVAKRCLEGAFGYSGQTCISVQRIYVNRALYPDFIKVLERESRFIKVGDPSEEDTVVTSLINENEAERVEEWIKENNADQILVGGERYGSVVEPTILTKVNVDASVSCKEIFGPVVIVDDYGDLDEAISKVNDSEYGLQAGIYTTSIDSAFKAFNALEVGGVIINDIPTFRVDQMPYGGKKNSGMGREGISFSMDEMSELKLGVFNLNT